MNNKKIQNNIDIIIKYDDDFKRQVAGDGRPYNPRISLGIKAGETSISGPEKGYTGVYLLNFFGELLKSIEELQKGNKKIIKTGDEPAYIVLEPQDDDSVLFSKRFTKESAKDAQERLSVEPEMYVTKQAIIDEIIRVSSEVLRGMRDINDNIDSYAQIHEFENLISEVRDR